MASQRFSFQNFVVVLAKGICGIAIALFVIGLAGAATARYFLTQLSTLPERPVYENDAPVAANTESVDTSASQSPNPANQNSTDDQQSAVTEQPQPEQPEKKVLFKATVTYSAGLLIRTGASVDYATIDGVEYNETIDVLEESGRWYRIRTSSGVEGWVKGKGNTRRL
ncbi:MAG: SH3 domain-containing protein [Cyanobacteria bacterium P01_D01_bin.156]